MLFKSANFSKLDIKADVGSRTVEGYASVFDVVDMDGDIIRKGAFKESIQRRGLRGVRFLWQHDDTQVLGVFNELKEDKHGLFFKAKISDTTLGNDVLTLLDDGAVDENSIGFMIDQGGATPIDPDNPFGGREITSIDVWENSIVTFASNRSAKITAVNKAMMGIPAHRLIQYHRAALAVLTKGTALITLINGRIEDISREGDLSRANIIQSMAEESDSSPSVVNDIMLGTVNCPSIKQLESFAIVLEVPIDELKSAAEQDGCEFAQRSAGRDKVANEDDPILNAAIGGFSARIQAMASLYT